MGRTCSSGSRRSCTGTHTAIETRRGVLYLNPCSAGPRRFDLSISIARVSVLGISSPVIERTWHQFTSDDVPVVATNITSHAG
jgi:hypothetical protein